MASENELIHAKAIYETACKSFDNAGWTYDRNDDDLVILSGSRGQNCSINILMAVDAEKSLAICYSSLNIDVPNDKSVDISIAISAINYCLVDGSFDYDFINKKIVFRIATTYKDSQISGDVFEYLTYIMCKTVDDYYKKLSDIANGSITISELLESIYNQ